jgi:murein DD-endopeptidase MepM/ murein hydrolase activator NlpD
MRPFWEGRGVAQPGQRACFGSRRSRVQISPPRPAFFLLMYFLGFSTSLTQAPVAAEPIPAWYRVRPGDNLTVIARRFGVTVGALKDANGLSGDLIRGGQRLQIQRPFDRRLAGDIAWRCPLSNPGAVVLRFGPHQTAQGITVPHTGVDLAAAAGAQLYCPAHGAVRYVGLQEGFGTVVIIEHGAGFSTVLAPLDPESVRFETGQAILKDDLLGRVGDPEEHDRPYLHLELRLRGKAIDPSPIQKKGS